MKMKYLKLIPILAMLPFYSNADKPDVRISSITFSQSRVIFHESDTHGVQFSLSNQSENPYLVQTKVTTLDGEKSKTYITTPPLFRLDEKEQTSIKVVKIGGEPDNEESMELDKSILTVVLALTTGVTGSSSPPVSSSSSYSLTLAAFIALKVNPSSIISS